PYQPAIKEELDQNATLVRSAIGFSQKRGDQVEIFNLRFAETAAVPSVEPSGWLSAFQFTKDDIMRAIEMVVMGLLGFVVVFMVVRPLVRRIITPDPRPVPALPPGGMFGDGPPIDPGLASIPAIASGDALKSDPNQTSKMIDLAQVQGQVHAQSV